MLVLAAVFMWLDLPAPTSHRGLSGSMFAGEAPSLDWENDDVFHSLDDPFFVRWTGSSSSEESGNPVHLFASRSATWSPDACDLGVLEGSSATPDAKRFAPRNATCFDAGSWHLFAVQEGKVIHEFEDEITIASGAAALERVSQNAETGFKGALDIQFQMHRPAAEDGFDGVWNRPVDIWITDGKQVCVASAAPVSAPRDPVRSGLSWKSSVHQARVELSEFKTVTGYSPFASQSDVASAADQQTKGNCAVNEGTLDVLVGPTERAWASAGQVFVHAAPVSLDEETIHVTVPAGEVAETTLRMRNPSSRTTRWSAKAVSLNDAEWLVGFANQEVKGSARGRGVITVSAADLQPGRYDAELRVTVDDYYGTTATIPVEINVVASRARSMDAASSVDGQDLPGTLQLGNYPNPFSGSTTVRLELPESGDVRIVVYDMTGREVRQMHDGYLSMGTHEFRFDAESLPSGTYLYRVSTNRGQETGTMTLVR